MLPKLIIYNTVSLDGCLTGFEPNLERYYEIAGNYKADTVLVGSNTAKTGMEMFLEEIPPEKDSDFKKPEIKSDDPTPLWVIPDSRGILQNILHVLRNTEYCKDVIILISKKTSKKYVNYLKERSYDYIIIGENHVDYKKAFEKLYHNYNVRVIRSDSGWTLNSILLEQGLADKLSLFISPIIVGNNKTNLFQNINSEKSKINLELVKNEIFDDNYILLVYKVKK
jgi:2,5-diamino-6-(ribosylamino)-4(3H)-pyrimidinone 5'-phosphate reductase